MTPDPIRDFYTSHPYPPPVDNLDRARDEWQDPNRHRAEFHLLWPDRSYRADLDILVAGCGTWQAAKYALCHPEARVVGIDVSTTSLEHTARLQQQYGLTNLDARQLPIEQAGALGRAFDLIVCTGVLHHLADPAAGLRALRAALKPHGALYLMVYAPYGRTGIYMLQDYCRRLGITASPDAIGELTAVVKALPPHHPLAPLLRGSRDFVNADALADALLNPRDRSYSVPQLFELIEGNGLRFARWYSQAPYLPQCGAIATTPHAKRLAALSEPDQYAAMELWRGAFASHSVILSRDDASPVSAKPGFHDREPWPRYVPVRLPGTLCIQERLPDGAAGVLMSRYHAYPDLIVIIDPLEKRMLDAVDGRRSIATIVDGAGGGRLLPRARGSVREALLVRPGGRRLIRLALTTVRAGCSVTLRGGRQLRPEDLPRLGHHLCDDLGRRLDGLGLPHAVFACGQPHQVELATRVGRRDHGAERRHGVGHSKCERKENRFADRRIAGLWRRNLVLPAFDTLDELSPEDAVRDVRIFRAEGRGDGGRPTVRGKQATLVFGMRERFGRGDHPRADPHTLGAMRKRLGDVRAGGDTTGGEDHHRLDGTNDAPQQRHGPDDALVVSASLPALRDHGIDARVRGLHGLRD